MQFPNASNNDLVKISDSRADDFTPLQLYDKPPSGLIELEKFKELALCRLSVLKIMETANLRFSRSTLAYNDYLDKELQRTNFLPTLLVKGVTSTNQEIAQKELEDDLISHYIVRLAYSLNDQLRRWFINQEVDLFRYRYLQKTSLSQAKMFLKLNNIYFLQVSEKEKSTLIDNIVSSCISMNVQRVFDTVFYKIPFTDVLDLVRSRRVFIKRGIAYVAASDMISIITNDFRMRLSHSLAILSRTSYRLIRDQEQIKQFLTEIPEGYCNYVSDDKVCDHLTSNDIDRLSKLCFPPCFRQLHEALRTEHHLKHQGRLTYWLFLKGIGLPMEENVRLFQNEFSQKGGMDQTKFDREHGYNIRHSYGKEGKRVSYTPYSCIKIINNHPPGSNEFHGCPFKHLNHEILRQRLSSYNLDTNQINQILNLSAGRHYQIACQRYFEFSHGLQSQTVCITHPNQYFNESYTLRFKDDITTNISNATITHPKSAKLEENGECTDDVLMESISDSELIEAFIQSNSAE
ncbi:hypothetical protein GJ496_006243 [Pomphorhynchus laevis]|nr:hypothetical protein GJ496_006243 [Pomphorhynchus laevis]